MILTSQQIACGEMAPWWYGRSYYMPHILVAVYHPMPFNWIVGWFRSLCWFIKSGAKDRRQAVYNKGYEAGRKQAHRFAYDQGVVAGRKELSDKLNTEFEKQFGRKLF